MKLDILAFGAHPDDVELSCAGTLAMHVDKGYKVGVIDLTLSQLSTRGDIENRKKEAEAAANAMGIHLRENLEMEDGYFKIDDEHRLKVIQAIRKYQPEIIIANSPDDRHPDHERAAELVKQANFYSGLVKIETSLNGKKQDPWRANSLFHYIQFKSHDPDIIVDIRGYADRKKAALKAYKSQFFDPDSDEPQTLIAQKGFIDMVQARNAHYGGMAAIFDGEGFLSERKPAVNDLMKLVHK